MQDLLDLDNSARMNTPSTIGINWKWRMLDNAITDELARDLYALTDTYFRLNVKNQTNDIITEETEVSEPNEDALVTEIN